VPRDRPGKPSDVAICALRNFVGVGAVTACKVAAEDTVDCLGRGSFFFLQNVLIIIDIYKASLVLSTSTASVEVRFFSFKMFLSLSIYIKQV
jgi:hypothetical protein